MIKNQSQLAHYAQISTGRMTQIMTLLNLAPEIQEAILCLPPVEVRRAPIAEIEVRRIAMEADWAVQRGMWEGIGGTEASHTCLGSRYQPGSSRVPLELRVASLPVAR